MGKLVFQATLGGQVNLVGPNTASTYDINVPAVAGDMVTTGDIGTVTNTMLAGSIANAKLANSAVTIGSTSVSLGSTAATVAGLTLTNPTINGFTGDTSVINVGSGQIYKDTSGNVGIGTSSPAFIYNDDTVLTINGKQSATGYRAALELGNNGSLSAVFLSTGVTTILGSYINNPLVFRTNNTERARIDTSGNLLVGTTSYGGVSSAGGNAYFGIGGTSSGNTGFLGLNGSSSSGYGAGIGGYSNGTNGWFIGSYSFVVSGTNTYLAMRNSGGGGVYLNGASATSWTAVSDETRKVIIEPITDAASKVSTLRAVIGRLKSDEEDVRRPYLIAQDVQAVLPEAVSEAEDKEGPVLGLSYTEVIPLLVAAIKEQQAIITSLTERITALEAPKV